jgi:hypothetical protein
MSNQVIFEFTPTFVDKAREFFGKASSEEVSDKELLMFNQYLLENHESIVVDVKKDDK